MELSTQERAFAAEVARSRIRAEVTQEWLARRIRLSRSKVSEICTGHFLPSRPALDSLITALSMDRDTTVGLWAAAQEARRQRLREQKMARVPRPEGWATLPALPEEVTSLLRAQTQAAEPLPYRLPGAREPSLATVYVRQDLGSGGEEAHPELARREVVLDGRGDLIEVPAAPTVRLAVRPFARTVTEVLDADDHLLITGGPGQGKSTLSLRLAAEVAQCWTGSVPAPLTEPVVPCRLSARALAARLDQPFPHALASAASAEYGALLASTVPPGLFEQRISGCRWLLIVDGLDEVADARQRTRLVEVLAALAQKAEPSFRVVLTTRPVEGATLAPLHRIGAVGYELLSFDDDALRLFATTWFADVDDDSAHRFVFQVREAHLDELVRVPLLATIAAIVFEQQADRPLPDNQYELYESYLRYLRTARSGPPGRFEARCDELLEHLGLVRLETDAPLRAAAEAWASAHLSPEVLTSGWQDELLTFLVAAGPLTLRGSELQFLHHSFAEHLAATAHARLLPESFDPDLEPFRQLLHAAQPAKRGRFARSVLVHYARLQPAEGVRVITWLCAGTADEHLLAARLLARRVPADPPVVDGFLATVRGWAMTTQSPGATILEQASRAANHPGLAAWLVALMRDDRAPWHSRAEAATALSTRLRGPHTPEALEYLRAAVDDPDAAVDHRLVAAEALAQCAGGERATAERGLRAVLADPAATGRSARSAAVVLAGFGAAPRADAAAALAALLADPWTPISDLVEIATGLIEISVAHHPHCAEAFRALLRIGLGEAWFDDAVTGMAALGADHAAEVVALLASALADPRRELRDRIAAARALAELGPQYRQAAGRGLAAMVDELGVTADDRIEIAASLTDCGGSFLDEGVDILRAALPERIVAPYTRMTAATRLLALDTTGRDDAAVVLRAVADDPVAGWSARASALGQLARLGEPHRDTAVAALRGDLTAWDADPELRCAAADELIRLGPEFHDEAADALLGLLAAHAEADVQIRAWQRLLLLDTRYDADADAAIAGLLAADEPGAWESAMLQSRLTRAHMQRLPAVVGVVAAAFLDRVDRVRAAAIRLVPSLDRTHHRAAVHAAVQLLRTGLVPRRNLVYWIRAFDDVGFGPRAEIADALRGTLTRLTGTEHFAAAADALVRRAQGSDRRLVAELLDAVADESMPYWQRARTVVALARVSPADGASATSLLLSTDRRGTASVPQHLLLRLAVLSKEVVPALHALLTAPDAGGADIVVAATVLAQVQPDIRSDLVAVLQEIATDELVDDRTRRDAVAGLADVDPTTASAGAARHQAVMANETVGLTERCEVAYDLARLDRGSADHACAFLRRCAGSSRALPHERAAATSNLMYLWPGSVPTTEIALLAAAVVRDPPPADSHGAGWLTRCRPRSGMRSSGHCSPIRRSRLATACRARTSWGTSATKPRSRRS